MILPEVSDYLSHNLASFRKKKVLLNLMVIIGRRFSSTTAFDNWKLKKSSCSCLLHISSESDRDLLSATSHR